MQDDLHPETLNPVSPARSPPPLEVTHTGSQGKTCTPLKDHYLPTSVTLTSCTPTPITGGDGRHGMRIRSSVHAEAMALLTGAGGDLAGPRGPSGLVQCARPCPQLCPERTRGPGTTPWGRLQCCPVSPPRKRGTRQPGCCPARRVPAVPCTRHAPVEAFPDTVWLPSRQAAGLLSSLCALSPCPPMIPDRHCSDQRGQKQ